MSIRTRTIRPTTEFIAGLIVSTLVSAGLFAYGSYRDDNLAFEYLLWNLFLAWIPFGLAVWLMRTLKHKLWSSWEALLLTLLWLIFLPNAFYMVSDFIHLQDVAMGDVLYDAVMLTSFVFTGLVLGFSGVYMVHVQLQRRVRPEAAASIVAFLLLVCSFAIYVGRDLRWNSWDVLTNPAGLLFDISARFIYSANYTELMLVVSSFFVLLGSMYHLLWRGARLLARAPER
jgi:uncharacterized membrane protein